MDAKTQRPKGRDSVLSTLNVATEAPTLAREVSSTKPAKAAFGFVSVLPTMRRVRLLPRVDRAQEDLYIGSGARPVLLACTNVCTALDWGMNGKQVNDLNQSVCEATNQLTT
jgi:hypothetical protein